MFKEKINNIIALWTTVVVILVFVISVLVNSIFSVKPIIGVIFKDSEVIYHDLAKSNMWPEADNVRVYPIEYKVKNANDTYNAIRDIAKRNGLGFIISPTYDTDGEVVRQLAKSYNLKFITLDSPLKTKNDKILNDVVYIGEDNSYTGVMAGRFIYRLLNDWDWDPFEAIVIVLSYNGFPYAVDHVEHLVSTLTDEGFSSNRIYLAQLNSYDLSKVQTAVESVLRSMTIKPTYVLLTGFNDEVVLEGLQEIRKLGYTEKTARGIGRNGMLGMRVICRDIDPMFYGSILIPYNSHSAESVTKLYYWVRKNQVPDSAVYQDAMPMYRQNYEWIIRKVGIPDLCYDEFEDYGKRTSPPPLHPALYYTLANVYDKAKSLLGGGVNSAGTYAKVAAENEKDGLPAKSEPVSKETGLGGDYLKQEEQIKAEAAERARQEAERAKAKAEAKSEPSKEGTTKESAAKESGSSESSDNGTDNKSIFRKSVDWVKGIFS